MAQIPLNTFKTTTFDILTSVETVYTTPAGVSTFVLLAQVANIHNSNSMYVSANHVRASKATAIIRDITVPINDSISLLSGKLILQAGDSITIIGSDENNGQFILSYLETANQ